MVETKQNKIINTSPTDKELIKKALDNIPHSC